MQRTPSGSMSKHQLVSYQHILHVRQVHAATAEQQESRGAGKGSSTAVELSRPQSAPLVLLLLCCVPLVRRPLLPTRRILTG